MHTEYRLTAEDETRIDAAIRGAYAVWGEPRKIDAPTFDALERIAAHSIGCTVYDLRDIELEVIGAWISALISAKAAR